MSEENNKNNHDVQIAVLSEKMGTMNDRFENLIDTVKKFIEITDKKLDREIFLEDKRHNHRMFEQMDKRIGTLENERENTKIELTARSGERDKILGMTKGTIAILIQLFTLFSLIIGLASVAGQ